MAAACLLLIVPGRIAAGPTLDPEALLRRWTTVTHWYDRSVHAMTIVAHAGGKEQVVYRALAPNIALGEVSISRDGTKVALLLVINDRQAGTQQRTIEIVPISDGVPRRVLSPYAPGRSPLAWSHDGNLLAFFGARAPGPDKLIVMDIRRDPAGIVFEHDIGQWHPLTQMPSQAWAPDNRRIVYSHRGEMVILDTATGLEERLGPGRDATWSPDGLSVAYQEQQVLDGDYYIVPVSAHQSKRRIIDNRGTMTDVLRLRGPFFGPSLWSPDGAHLLVGRYIGPGEQSQGWIIEVSTGRMAAVPIGRAGDLKSLGGIP